MAVIRVLFVVAAALWASEVKAGPAASTATPTASPTATPGGFCGRCPTGPCGATGGSCVPSGTTCVCTAIGGSCAPVCDQSLCPPGLTCDFPCRCVVASPTPTPTVGPTATPGGSCSTCGGPCGTEGTCVLSGGSCLCTQLTGVCGALCSQALCPPGLTCNLSSCTCEDGSAPTSTPTATPTPSPSTTPTLSGCENCAGDQFCDDGIDNDGNGAIDCADSACNGVAVCAVPAPVLSARAVMLCILVLATVGLFGFARMLRRRA